MIRLRLHAKPTLRAWNSLFISIINCRYVMKLKFMKMWKLHTVNVSRISLAGRYVYCTVAKRRRRECLHAWLLLTGKCLEQRKIDRVTTSVAHRLKGSAFNHWYSFAVARENKRNSLSLAHFQAWVKYLAYKRKKMSNFADANKHYLLKLYQRGMRGLYKHHSLVGINIIKMKLTLALRYRYRMKSCLRKMIRSNRFKRFIKMTERSFHYWRHISYGPDRKLNSVLDFTLSINRPDIYTNDITNCNRIHKMRSLTQWKAFVRTNLLRKIRTLIRRWRTVVLRRRKVIIAASTMFTDAGNRIRKYYAFRLLNEKVSMIRAWKQKISRWRKPLALIDKYMRLSMLLTRFRLWYLSTGPANIVEQRRILRRRFKIWRKEYLGYAFYRYILLKKVTNTYTNIFN